MQKIRLVAKRKEHRLPPALLFLYEPLYAIMKNIEIVIIILTSLFINSCRENKSIEVPSEFETTDKEVIMEYYDPEFELEPSSNLRTNGYYEVKEFKTYDFSEKEDYYERPNYGFVQFYKDGFCRVGAWNGIHKYSADVEKSFKDGKGYVFDGLYQIQSDTVRIEYLYNAVSPGAGQANSRHQLIARILDDKLIFMGGYTYPYKNADTLTSRCVGRFVKAKYDENARTNYLKENISEYLADQK